MDASLWNAFRAAATELGAHPDHSWRTPMGRYLELLMLWNKKINLTAVRDPADMVIRHFADSLAVLADIPASAKSLLDVGSGGGFPGAILAIVRPELAVTLVESIQKKAAFLSTLRREIPAPNLTVKAERIEDLAKGKSTPKFDVVVSRAAIPLPGWFDVAAPFVAKGGTILAMEGQSETDLPPGVVRRAYSLDGTTRSILRRST